MADASPEAAERERDELRAEVELLLADDDTEYLLKS